MIGKMYDVSKVRQPFASRLTGTTQLDLRRNIVEQFDIVAVLESISRDKGLDARLIQDAFELDNAVGRIDGYENDTCLRSCKLRDDPFQPIGGPDAQPVSRREAELKQVSGDRSHFLLKFPVRQASVLLQENRGILIGVQLGGAIQGFPDRLVKERLFTDATAIAIFRHVGGVFTESFRTNSSRAGAF
jgi:hypothetical protein